MNKSIFTHSESELINVPETLPSATWQECWIPVEDFLSVACSKALPERHHLPWPGPLPALSGKKSQH